MRPLPSWQASVAIALVCLVVLGVLVSRWSRLDDWGRWHRLAVAAGALVTSRMRQLRSTLAASALN